MRKSVLEIDLVFFFFSVRAANQQIVSNPSAISSAHSRSFIGTA
jgi:hypothetical protein